ncbi:cell division protein FtsQ/DivIB [Parvibaculum sp.]|uniref:cell division protein FtsQ/DivIB n=1 Tax=Parvibaculum sp. TaxID=2024848 RepID=UPI001B184908|nr:cell division protein FtsQ/DivIB [Parvibaculum sp.]MBO6633273.1 cell division protein FtsQ/DivIB [Parvibaculum sp.]MBO6679746.1 cell division protein FtsQ/DivIB [Parvibaculum sp.]MBO6683593.1 cell division protein FtsQ/DivIB [Parvibaculum sp.]MBO6905866.1 cell division protein FtsQ/DivIB [Parvibaculum sp.]
MRQVKKASRTGVRTAPKKKGSKIAPGKRRNASTMSTFGRRKERPAGALMQWIDNVREGNFGARPFAWGAFVLLGLVAIYGFAVGGHAQALRDAAVAKTNRVLALSGFSIQDVRVTGRAQTRKADLLVAVGVERGDPIFGFDTEAARQRIERLGWVRSATVTRLLPDTIRIEVVEREPFALWQRGGALSLIDAEGRPISEEGVQDFAHLPFIVGFGAPREAPGLLNLMRTQQPQLLSRVRAFVRVGDRRWNLRLENGVDVKLPETGVEAALSALVTYDAQHRILSRDIVAVDLRLPDRVSVELTESAAADGGIATEAKMKQGVARPGGPARGGNT